MLLGIDEFIDSGNIGMIDLDAPGTSRCDNVCFFFKLNFSSNLNVKSNPASIILSLIISN